MIISKFFDSNSDPVKFKAPKGFMYNIFDIHFSVTLAGSNIVGVLNYLLEDEVDQDDWNVANAEGVLAIIATNIAGQAEDFNFTKGEMTKFISIAANTSTVFACFIIIHFELVKASKTELILEWFRKGR